MKRFSKKVCAFSLAAAVFCGSLPAFAAEAEQSAPVTLKQSVEATLQHNPNLKAFQEYRQAAFFDKKRARNGFYPRVDVRAGYGLEQWEDTTTRAKNSKQDKHKFYTRSDAALTLTQNIWDGLGTWSRYRMSDAMLQSAEHRLFDNAEALSLDAILAHIEIVRQKRLVELSEVNVRNHEAMLGSQVDRHKAGASSLADVTQTQARLSRAQSSLSENVMALDAAVANYRKLTGGEPGNLELPVAPTYAYPSLENVLANAMTSNSKVLSKRADVDASYAQKELDKSEFHPRVYIEAGPEYRYRNESSLTDAWGTTVQLRTDWNLYNGHYDWYNVKGDKARIRQGNRELQALRENLAEETTSTWSQWQNTREQVKYYANAVGYNTQTRDMYLEQFNVGQRSLMDLLDSENELYSSSMLLTTAQANEIAAQYRLLTLGGKLLGYFDINKSNYIIDTTDDDNTDRDLAGTTINNHSYLPGKD